MDLHLAPHVEAKLNALAGRRGRNSDALVAEAVEQMVDHDEWFLRQVDLGLASVEQGRTLSHQEVGDCIEHYLSTRPVRT